MRQEDMGRVESKRHFKEMVTRFGDSLESGEGGQKKGNIPSQGEGLCVEGALCQDSAPHPLCPSHHGVHPSCPLASLGLCPPLLKGQEMSGTGC